MEFATEIFSSKILPDLDIYKEIFEQGTVGIVIFDENFNICYVNQRSAQVLDRSSDQLLGRPYLDFIDPREKELSLQRVSQTGKAGVGNKAYLRRLVLPNGNSIWTRIELRAIEKDGSKYFLAQIIDISDDVKIKESLTDIEQQVQMAFDAAPIGMALVGQDGMFQKVNRQLCELLDYSEEEILQLHFKELVHPDELQESIEEYKQMLAGKVQILPNEAKRFTDSKGNIVWINRSIAVVHPENKPPYFILQVQDRTATHNLEEELSRLAYQDLLTGLGNRAALARYIDNFVSQKIPVSLILMDLDNFKYINDSLGHGAGDALLVEFGRRVKNCVGPSGFTGRLGGDEFVVVLPQTSAEQLDDLAKKILQLATVTFDLLGYQLAITVSIGVTESSNETKGKPDDILGELLRRADLALYGAKHQGKGQVCFFDLCMYERLFERLNLEIALRKALDNDALEIEYEPIFDLEDGTLVAVEALCRWNDKQMGVIPREKFIPLAEDAGLIFQLGEFVLRQSCKEVANLSQQIGQKIGISVRVSSFQLAQLGFSLLVTDIVSSSGMIPSQLTVLKEETCSSFQLIHDNLFQLQKAGIAISLDGFGAGYSSLSHLDDCVVGQIKIDSSFVSKITDSNPYPPLLESIFSFSRAINAQVAARGIETTLQLESLREMGCELGQGLQLGLIGPISSMPFRRKSSLDL